MREACYSVVNECGENIPIDILLIHQYNFQAVSVNPHERSYRDPQPWPSLLRLMDNTGITLSRVSILQVKTGSLGPGAILGVIY
jgi:hypothetical protein